MFDVLLDHLKERLSETQLHDIQVASTFLMKRQFFYDGPNARVAVRNALGNNLTRNVVRDLLSFNGFDLISDEGQGWWGAMPSDEIVERSASRLETLVLLILSTTYSEAMKNADIDARQNALVSFNGFCARFEEITGAAQLKAVKVPELKAVLKRLETNSIVQLNEIADDEEECELVIRPMIIRITGPAFTARLNDFMSAPRDTVPTAVDLENDEANLEIENDQSPPPHDPEINDPVIEEAEVSQASAIAKPNAATKFARPSFL